MLGYSKLIEMLRRLFGCLSDVSQKIVLLSGIKANDFLDPPLMNFIFILNQMNKLFFVSFEKQNFFM